jgi:hypothetical protein
MALSSKQAKAGLHPDMQGTSRVADVSMLPHPPVAGQRQQRNQPASVLPPATSQKASKPPKAPEVTSSGGATDSYYGPG